MIHHGSANRLPIGWPHEFAHNPPPGHHADAIRQAENLVKILADEHNGSTALARSQQALVHSGAGARVEPATWTVRDDDRRLAAEFSRNDELLRVAPREQSGLLIDAPNALHVIIRDRWARSTNAARP